MKSAAQRAKRLSRHHSAPARFIEGLEGRVFFSIYTVTSLGDGAGTITPAGSGKFNASTLRAAINAANKHVGADTVNFATPLVGTINLGTALPAIYDTLTIVGPGASRLAVARSASASANFSIFHLNGGKIASISGLTITRGTGISTRGGGTRDGGGIWSSGQLTVKSCVLTANSVGKDDGNGGAIFNYAGAVTVTGCTFAANQAFCGGGIGTINGRVAIAGCTFTGNAAGWQGGALCGTEWTTLTVDNCSFTGCSSDGTGGAIHNDGTATVNQCSFNGNAVRYYDGGSGGAIYNDHLITVTNCSFTSNTVAPPVGVSARGFGGALFSAGYRPVATVAHCTFSGNVAPGGGGIYNSGTMPLSDCTLNGNRATGTGGGGGIMNGGSLAITNCTVVGNTSGGAGGIYNGFSATLGLGNSIVAGNSGGSAATGDIFGTADPSSSYNIFGTGGAGGLTNGVNGNRVGVTAAQLKLGALAFNGGPTKTMALLAGSIAINAGSNALATNAKLYADQRGLPRMSGGTVDAGAFEVQALGGASIAGTFFNDKNRDGVRQSATEPGLPNWQVYVDQNKNGVYDPGEISSFTSSTGTYKFAGLSAGSYRLYEYRQDGWTRTKPAGVYPLGYYDVTVTTNQAVFGKDFGNYLA